MHARMRQNINSDIAKYCQSLQLESWTKLNWGWGSKFSYWCFSTFLPSPTFTMCILNVLSTTKSAVEWLPYCPVRETVLEEEGTVIQHKNTWLHRAEKRSLALKAVVLSSVLGYEVLRGEYKKLRITVSYTHPKEKQPNCRIIWLKVSVIFQNWSYVHQTNAPNNCLSHISGMWCRPTSGTLQKLVANFVEIHLLHTHSVKFSSTSFATPERNFFELSQSHFSSTEEQARGKTGVLRESVSELSEYMYNPWRFF